MHTHRKWLRTKQNSFLDKYQTILVSQSISRNAAETSPGAHFFSSVRYCCYLLELINVHGRRLSVLSMTRMNYICRSVGEMCDRLTVRTEVEYDDEFKF